MFEQEISVGQVKKVVTEGKIIKDYPDDKPYPSKLILGFINGAPIHVVAAYNEIDNEIIVITVYTPSENLWDSNFERKK